MHTLYPFTFYPILKERIWGGDRLAKLYGKPVPPGVPIGESWEISDRPDEVSTIENGPLAGKTLRWLLEHHGKELAGNVALPNGRFPLLIKLLDARDKLSLQVHPPTAVANTLGGCSKTEMWFIVDADQGAELYAGLRKGATRAEFEQKLRTGRVSECFHRVRVRSGDAMFLPSGRVHAIGSGLVIFEIQENSDTTYRVFDWNRTGSDGKPRALHVAESLKSIDFTDFEPGLVQSRWHEQEGIRTRELVRDPLFRVSELELPPGSQWRPTPGTMRIVALVSGSARVSGGKQVVPLAPGRFCLIPACLNDSTLETPEKTTFLNIEAGS